MHFNPYGGAAAQVAAALVNAGSVPAAELLALIRAEGMTLTDLTVDEGPETVDWARRLRQVFEETDPVVRMNLVNRLLDDSACRPYISRHDGLAPHLHYASESAGSLSRIRAYTAGGLAHLICDDPDRIGHCARPGCDTVYVDTSRNGRRRFCSTRCATRVHVAQHRDRQRV
ncbi:CGNR zinc finger domain-containing protein [Amycolatopsis palatopharyngis]|uniref:CGNR zinc finger domain-containing protein n=1 Tax=Amycolatopsis palatopharyngis TaxID=187982 RepID=UPI000E21C79D|nr:CGNR zinc finger domain-containing protein [Amycolatopsis palatopharyngis]